MRIWVRLAALGIAAIALAACGSGRRSSVAALQPPPPPGNASELAAALRSGGYVLFVRHAATDRAADNARVNLDDCSTQRALSAAGLAQAHAIAAGLKRLRIPIGEVRASPYCRTADTARLAFGYMLLDNDLRPLRDPNAGAHLAAVRRLLATAPLPGKNTALVGHADTFQKVAGFDLGDAEIAVIRPNQKTGTWTLLGRIGPEQWAAIR
ncbi:MAG: histidine phosphatase family protein [bacterium]